jgi:hypothetical protein
MKICLVFWKMIIIGCTTIILVVVDRGYLEAFSKVILDKSPQIGLFYRTRGQLFL